MDMLTKQLYRVTDHQTQTKSPLLSKSRVTVARKNLQTNNIFNKITSTKDCLLTLAYYKHKLEHF